MLSPEERALFKERIQYLDRKIQPGLKKLHWSLKGASAAFISECRLHASKVQTIVNEYKAATLAIARSAQQISEALLVRITSKRVYNDLEFEEDQKEHRAWVQQKLMDIHEEVTSIMRQTYEVFKHDSAEVQQYWMAYTIKMNRMMEEAFRLSVKWSLLELSKAINGDGKTTPNPLFRVKVILQDNYPAPSAQLEFSPSLAQLVNMVNNISSHLITSISVFHHLPEILTKRRFLRVINIKGRCDEDIKKIQALISGGMQANAMHLQAYLKTWDVYREIWEVRKDSFINRYQQLNPFMSFFDADTARFLTALKRFVEKFLTRNAPPDLGGPLVQVRQVLDRLQEAELTIKAEKCKVGMAEVSYLGRWVGSGRLKPEPAKVEEIRDWPAPHMKKQVQAFIGLAGYYQRFVPRFSAIATPITELCKKGKPDKVVWTEQCQEAFRALKEALISGPVLMQEDEKGERHPIVYLSKKLLPWERHYAAIEKECLAMVWALKKLEPYLFGRHFTVYTDHSPLTWLHQMKGANAKLLRWSLLLQDYNMDMVHVKGSANLIADALSQRGGPELPQVTGQSDPAQFSLEGGRDETQQGAGSVDLGMWQGSFTGDGRPESL
ncbi:unnamed protein product [Natator depressus]